MTATATLLLRDFDPHNPADQPAFQRLNEEWINLHFTLEPKDVAALLHPDEAYLAPGGRIFLAFEDETALGCCALIRTAPTQYEVSKMAVTQSAQGKGVGRRLLAHTIEEARKSGATRLYLDTNHTLAPAIHLYESLGFRPVPPDRLTPSPYARADVHMELFLT